METLPKEVRIVEVGPRDGLQNEKTILSLETKVEFVRRLLRAGIRHLEVTSFVREDKIPQMKNSKELFEQLKLVDSDDVSLIALVPNTKGLEKALEAGVRKIAVFSATSDTFNQKNIGTDTSGSLERIRDICRSAAREKVKTRGHISTVFSCPYEEKTSLKKLMEICELFFSLGLYEISLADTMGSASTRQVAEVLKEIKKNFPLDKFVMHFHDTNGMALPNILFALNLGIRRFDSSVGGLGGCPYAPGASGNVDTLKVVHLMDSLGVKTGIDQDRLAEASSFIFSKIKEESPKDMN